MVFTNGCYDLLHPGHIRLLEQARSLGDILILALNSDASVRRLKGPSRPLIPEQERAEVAAALEAVDAVTLFDEDTPRELIAAVLPDVLVKGADWAHLIAGREEVEAAGGRVHGAGARTRILHHRHRRNRSCRDNLDSSRHSRSVFRTWAAIRPSRNCCARCTALSRAPAPSLSGLTTTAKALYSVLLWQMTERPLIIVVDGNKQAEALSEAAGDVLSICWSRQPTPNGPQLAARAGRAAHAEHVAARRDSASSAPSACGGWPPGACPITVMPVASALLRLEPPDFYRQLALTLRAGDEIPLEEWWRTWRASATSGAIRWKWWANTRCAAASSTSSRPKSPKPVRIDLFGDQMESIRRFEVESQRSVLKMEECTLLPLTEYQKSRALLAELNERLQESGVSARDLPAPGEPFPGWELLAPMVRPHDTSIFSLLDRAIVLWDEPEQIRGAAERLWKRLEQVEPSAGLRSGAHLFPLGGAGGARPRAIAQVAFRELEIVTRRRHAAACTSPRARRMSFHGNMQVAIAEARTLVEAGSRVAFFVETTGEVERVADIFNEYGVPYQLGIEQTECHAGISGRARLHGRVGSEHLPDPRRRAGAASSSAIPAWRFSAPRICSIPPNWWRVRPAASRASAPSPPTSFDLKPGDYVVHAEHGVGQFLGLREIAAGRRQGRLHAARVRRRQQALCPADAHGPGAALPRRRRIEARARPHGRRHLDPHQDAQSKPKCATWRTSC